MRRARITYQGAFHHAMNRGYEGRSLFQDDSDREFFLDLVKKYSKLLKTRIFAYCLMDNHYHLVLENTSRRMSDFFKQINGQFGTYFRQKYSGRGYVYQDRFKSLLIQDESYLMMVIGYGLNNPVRAKLVKHFLDYSWSSAGIYFQKEPSEFLDKDFVEELFGSKKELKSFVENLSISELPIVKAKMGKMIGGEEFINKALKKADRRITPEHTLESKRIDDLKFIPIGQVYHDFEQFHDIKIEQLDFHSISGRRLRAELLVHLKDRGGLKYTEIIKLPEFSSVKLFSLGRIYGNAKKKMENK